MTRRAFLQKYLLKFVIALVMLGLIVYALGHALGIGAETLLTTPVRDITDHRITSAYAYLFRDERLLEMSGAGLVDELVISGEKVGKNVAVADWYPSADSAEALEERQRMVNAINRALYILEESDVRGEPISNAEGYRADAVKHYQEICAQLREGKTSGVLDLEDALLTDLNRYLSLSGKLTAEETASMVQVLQAQKKMLLGADYETIINTEASGVYYGNAHVDGYETIFTTAALEGLTSEGLAALRETEPSLAEGTQTVGKMVYGYSWYAVMELPADLVESFTVGTRYRVAFPENEGRTLELTLERLDGTLAVFRSDDSPSDFVYYRAQTVEITVDTCQGFYIPSTALYELDGVEGVYVFENGAARFRRIEVLYRGEGYCIAARPADSETSQLRESDVLITSGRNMYDGKVYE